MPSPCEAAHATSATTAGTLRAAPELRTTGNPGVAPRQDDAAASGTRRDTSPRPMGNQQVPTEHDEEKGKERGCHWLWEGARSSRAAPRERAIHSGRLTGQCTSRHTTSLLTDGHGTAAVDRTNPPHSRRETEVPPGGSNGFALACGCRRGEGFFMKLSSLLSKLKTLETWDRHHLAKFEIVKFTSQNNMPRRRSVRGRPEKCRES